jgi:signal transduction histidine kinase
MDDSKEGILLIGTTMVILVAFALTVLAVMIIYRRRKLQHIQEIREMNEKFSRELLEAQLEVQRQTMQHIGREIHDNVGQQLTLAFLRAQAIRSGNQNIDSQIQSVGKIINGALADLRNLSRSLTDPNLLEKDINQLIQLECAKIKSTKLCDINFKAGATVTGFSIEVKSFVLRILQEFLQNSVKHSKCTSIEIDLEHDTDGVMLMATDNGIGFVETEQQAGLGLASMRKRAAIIGAELSIESEVHNGTRLRLFVPLKPQMFAHAT